MGRLIAPLLLSFSVSAAALAAAPSTTELVETAWQRHPQARGLDARRAELMALADLAAGWTPGPGSVGIGNRNDQTFERRGQLEWELEYAQPVWLPGQAGARREEAAAALRTLEAERSALRLGLTRSVLDAHRNWRLARGLEALAERRLEVATQLAADLARRVRAGESPRFDLNLAEGERLSAEGAVAEQRLAVADAGRAFAVLVGRLPPETLAAPVPSDVPAEHPALAAAREAAALATARLAVTRQSLRDNPEVGLRLRRERGGYGEGMADSVMVRVVIPLASAPRTAAREAGAQAAVTESAVTLARRRSQLEADQASATDQLATARALEESARRRQQLAEDNVQLADRAWRLGERPLEALLRARAASFDADSGALRARFAREQAEAWRDYLKGVAE